MALLRTQRLLSHLLLQNSIKIQTLAPSLVLQAIGLEQLSQAHTLARSQRWPLWCIGISTLQISTTLYLFRSVLEAHNTMLKEVLSVSYKLVIKIPSCMFCAYNDRSK